MSFGWLYTKFPTLVYLGFIGDEDVDYYIRNAKCCTSLWSSVGKSQKENDIYTRKLMCEYEIPITFLNIRTLMYIYCDNEFGISWIMNVWICAGFFDSVWSDVWTKFISNTGIYEIIVHV